MIIVYQPRKVTDIISFLNKMNSGNSVRQFFIKLSFSDHGTKPSQCFSTTAGLGTKLNFEKSSSN